MCNFELYTPIDSKPGTAEMKPKVADFASGRQHMVRMSIGLLTQKWRISAIGHTGLNIKMVNSMNFLLHTA